MEQIKRATYLVNSGETIDVEVQATKVGSFAICSVQGAAPPAVGLLHWRFTIGSAKGHSEFGMIVCAFPSDAPDDARYDIFFTGSAGGVRLQGSDIVKTDAFHSRGFELRVV